MCNVHTVVISNKMMSFGQKKEEYDPNKAVMGRVEVFQMKSIDNPNSNCIHHGIEQELPGILMLCNDVHFERKANCTPFYPIDDHPKIVSILRNRKREEEKKRKREEIQEELIADQEIIPVSKKQRIQTEKKNQDMKDNHEEMKNEQEKNQKDENQNDIIKS